MRPVDRDVVGIEVVTDNLADSRRRVRVIDDLELYHGGHSMPRVRAARLAWASRTRLPARGAARRYAIGARKTSAVTALKSLDSSPPAVQYLGAGGIDDRTPTRARRSRTRTLAPLLTAVLLLSPVAGQAQTLQDVATALGAANLKSIEVQGSGATFQVGQSQAPGMPWPQFNAKSFARLVNYDTASLREDAVRIRALEPPRGGGPVRPG